MAMRKLYTVVRASVPVHETCRVQPLLRNNYPSGGRFLLSGVAAGGGGGGGTSWGVDEGVGVAGSSAAERDGVVTSKVDVAVDVVV